MTSLSNEYSHYYIDKDGNEIMTLQNFIRLQALRMGMTDGQLIDAAGLSYPTYRRSFKELLSVKSLAKLAAYTGVSVDFLKVLPIDEADFQRMKENRYSAPAINDSEETIKAKKEDAAMNYLINSLNKSTSMKQARREYQSSDEK